MAQELNVVGHHMKCLKVEIFSCAINCLRNIHALCAMGYNSAMHYNVDEGE